MKYLYILPILGVLAYIGLSFDPSPAYVMSYTVHIENFSSGVLPVTHSLGFAPLLLPVMLFLLSFIPEQYFDAKEKYLRVGLMLLSLIPITVAVFIPILTYYKIESISFFGDFLKITHIWTYDEKLLFAQDYFRVQYPNFIQTPEVIKAISEAAESSTLIGETPRQIKVALDRFVIRETYLQTIYNTSSNTDIVKPLLGGIMLGLVLVTVTLIGIVLYSSTLPPIDHLANLHNNQTALQAHLQALQDQIIAAQAQVQLNQVAVVNDPAQMLQAIQAVNAVAQAWQANVHAQLAAAQAAQDIAAFASALGS